MMDGLHSAFHPRISGALPLTGWGGEGWLWGQSCDRQAGAPSFILHTHFWERQIPGSCL